MKNNQPLNYNWLLIILITLVSCIEEVDPKGLLTTDKKVVINSFISPQDSVISVEVSLSTPLLGIKRYDQSVDADIVRDAEVTLSDGDKSIILPFDNQRSYFVKSKLFPIMAGKTYFLNVKSGQNEYKASCRVPETTASGISASAGKTVDGRRLRVFWKDSKGQENYYRLSGSYKSNFSGSMDYSNTIYFYEEGFKKDTNRDGAMISADTDIFVGQESIDSIKVQLLTTDKNYFDYQKTIFDHDESGENPFSEPVRLVSNIEGKNGLGIFAAYQSVIKKVKVEQ